MSAPARSIEATAMSISRCAITSVIGSRWTSTSNIERSIVSGFIPCDIVRLPCGSRSMQSTRSPFSANATPRLSVVVVFATPPFWFANAITCVCAGAFAFAAWRTEGRGSRRATAIYALLSRLARRVPSTALFGDEPRAAPPPRSSPSAAPSSAAAARARASPSDPRPLLGLDDELAQLVEQHRRRAPGRRSSSLDPLEPLEHPFVASSMLRR